MEAAFADRAIYLPESDTLVLADLHLGRGASADIELPLSEEDVPPRIDGLCDRFLPTTVVLAGDVLHAFSHVPTAAREAFREVEAVVENAGARLVVTPGNHDTMLDGVWDGPTPTAFSAGETTILHGHEPPDREAERYVVGHDHPKITIEGDDWPCYLLGEGIYHGADVLVLPAFTRLASGVAVNGGHGHKTLERSPLVTDIERFRPVVRDEDRDETLEFPSLGEFRELL
ncbi:MULTISPECIES: metallophosphoesterase [Halococcus]|uniref:Metallophosphoesterase n=1 Tax=Halococcus salifodinae DSM 8989 TaxID=1227456 RepID=M0MXT8_9EURY|nr:MULTISPECIES: metallophosphoesterase [Halococcus]EMA50128.1 metallophosphoesterase [Halococcus salifodinae DSM 8989]